MNWKTYTDEYGSKKKARGNQIELYETLYDTITAWGEDCGGNKCSGADCATGICNQRYWQ